MSDQFWTDYPITELGDKIRVQAPIRECRAIAHDGDKYVTIQVDGVTTEIKRGYVYKRPGRCGEVPHIGDSTLRRLRRNMGSQS